MAEVVRDGRSAWLLRAAHQPGIFRESAALGDGLARPSSHHADGLGTGEAYVRRGGDFAPCGL